MSINRRIFALLSTVFLVSVSALLLVPTIAPSQVFADGPDSEYFSVSTVTVDGVSLDKITINGPPVPPPGFVRTTVALPEPNKAAGINVLSNVPALDWSYGCSATSAAMIAGYYDRTLYPDMYTGATDGGVFPLPTDASIWGYTAYGGSYPTTCMECPLSATHNGVDSRSVRGHVDDYWVEYKSTAADPFSGSWAEHSYGDCTGDYMKTNQYAYGNTDGSTTFWNYNDGTPLYYWILEEAGPGVYDSDGGYGLKLFYESRGYTVANMYNQKIKGQGTDPELGFTYAQYKAEIDAGRPVMIHLENHTIVGLGYDDTSSDLMYIHDTWGYDTPTMIWGSTYGGMQHLGVTIVQLASPGAQTWYLDDDDVMYKGVTDNAEGSIEIGDGESNIWISDEAAATDVTFASSNWRVRVAFTSAPSAADTFTVEIGSSTNGSDFTAGGPVTILNGNGTTTVFSYPTDAASVTVPNGNYLALRITNNNGSDYSVVTGLIASYTNAPSTDPGYPVPELASIVLLGGGLTCLGGYLLIKRRRLSE